MNITYFEIEDQDILLDFRIFQSFGEGDTANIQVDINNVVVGFFQTVSYNNTMSAFVKPIKFKPNIF